jgi:hypothetical protein
MKYDEANWCESLAVETRAFFGRDILEGGPAAHRMR